MNSPSARQSFVVLTGGQQVVEAAPHFMVICGDTNRHRVLVEREGLVYKSNFECFLLATIDATLFAQNMVIAFESMGYGTCYIGGVRNDITTAAKLLELPDGVYPLFGLCVGIPDQESLRRPRLPHKAVLFEDRYISHKDMLDNIDEFDNNVAPYYEARVGKPTTWSR